jgi:iduronate 2-sulfatase
MKSLSPIIMLLVFSFSGWLLATGQQAAAGMNILFIAADDLRPQLNCYGRTDMITPNLDNLASEGLLFNRAYCQAATCRASRVSLLTGLRPDSTEIWTNHSRHNRFRDHLPTIVTLPQQFKNHGYHTQGFGKIFHGGLIVRDEWNDPASWSVPAWFGQPRYYYTEAGVSAAKEVFKTKTGAVGAEIDDWVNHFVLGLSVEAPDVDDEVLQDGQIATHGIRALRAISRNGNKPFFLALGFLKPHLPVIAPKKYWDLYPPDKVKVATNREPPKDAPAVAETKWGHSRTYTDFPDEGEPPEKLVFDITRGYAACVSYVDAQVGRVLVELDRLGLRENTIVIFWGDHGWHIGENHNWGKRTNYELSTRAPLILRDPRMKGPGRKTNALVEFVDIFPSLCELAGLPLPGHLEGTSFAPLLEDPKRPWKEGAFSQFPSATETHMGRTIRTDRYRFIQWSPIDDPEVIDAMELYDHESDWQENFNIANRSENERLVKQLQIQLAAGWQAALPR